MEKYETGGDPKTDAGEWKPPKGAPKPSLEEPLALQNIRGMPEQSDVRGSLAHMLRATSHIHAHIEDLSSLLQRAKERVTQLEETLQVLRGENLALQRNIQKLQNSQPAQVQREENEKLRELEGPRAGEHPESRAQRLTTAQTPAARPHPDPVRPVVIDIEEEEQDLQEAESPPPVSGYVESVLKSWRAWSFSSLTEKILQVPPKVLKYLDTATSRNFAYQAEDELVEVVVPP